MNKQQLAAKIWSGANNLRGKISASKYKDYMLGFIFYKYLSDKEVNYLKKNYWDDEKIKQLDETNESAVKACKKNLGYFIAYSNLYSKWIEDGSDFEVADVRVALSAFNRLIDDNHKKVYENIFNTLETGLNEMGNTDADRTKSVRGLLDIIQSIPTDQKQGYDVLGFIYEYLLKNFAANAGKAGEFYTPYEASFLMSEIIANHLKDRKQIDIYDPTSGSGSLLLNIGTTLSKHIEDQNRIKYYAQELIPETFNLTRMNLVMRDVLPNNICARCGDTLGDDWPFFVENDRERTYDPVFVDACVSNPPYSQKWETSDRENDIRFSQYGIAPKGKADYAFLLHNLYHLKNDGIMTIVLPHGVLFRGGEEEKIRTNLIEKDNIDTIIGMPANMFFGTGIPTIIMILKKQRENNDVLFIDASKGFAKEGTKNVLKAKDVRKIVDTVIERKEIEKYSRVVSKEEIRKNNYNLNIPRYVDSTEKPESFDIYASMFGGIPNKEIDELDKYWEMFPSLKKELFEEENIPYSSLKTERIKETIINNNDVKEFQKQFDDSFKTLDDYLTKELINNKETLNISKEEDVLAFDIKERVRDLSLIDYYEAYQALDDQWKKISLDLELIQSEGIDCIKQVDPNMVIKKKNDKETQVQDGWIGHIIPFNLVQKRFFSDKENKLNQINNMISSLESEKSEVLDSLDQEDKSKILKDESEDIDSKKFKSKIKEINADIKKGEVYEEESFEKQLLRIDDINTKINDSKKKAKELDTKLTELTKSFIESMNDEQIVQLLKDKWVLPLIINIKKLLNKAIKDLTEKVDYLSNKYSTTLKDVSSDIDKTEKELVSLISELEGNEFDMKGLEEFKTLLNGDKDE